MYSFSSAIKNQHSFNKMIEAQIAQLVAAIPSTDKGKIPNQLEDPETTKILSRFIIQNFTKNHQAEDGEIIPCPSRKVI